MSDVFVNFNGVAYRLSGVVSATPVQTAPILTPIIPVMTGPNTSGFIASATSEYNSSGVYASAWLAFRNVVSNQWNGLWSSLNQATSSSPQILRIIFPTAKSCSQASITARSDSGDLSPISWDVQTTVDGVNWVTQASESAKTWTGGETKTDVFQNPGSYLGVQWVCKGSGALCQIAKAQVFG